MTSPLGTPSLRSLLTIAIGCVGGVTLAGCTPFAQRGGAYINMVRPDQRPPLVGAEAAADSLWGAAAASERGDGIVDARRADLQELVERFAPSVVLPRSDNIRVDGHRYWMLPTNVQLYIDTLHVDVIEAAPYRFIDSVNVELRGLTSDSLVALVEARLLYRSDPSFLALAYFDFPGKDPRQWWQAYGQFRTGPDSVRWATPTVYAHPFIDPRGRLAIQYWYFYPVNDFVANHEGDWEHIIVIPTDDRRAIAEVHYYFHQRSLVLPQRRYTPHVVDGTHPTVWVSGRMYNVFDYPIRVLYGDHNEGSHGSFPFPGEWEGVGGMGGSESVQPADSGSPRVVSFRQFDVVLTPEPSRIAYRQHPEVLREWAWLLLPVRWGFPISQSAGSGLGMDVGNRAPWGPAFSTAWNRTAPGLLFPAYRVRKVPVLRSLIEDVLQPWYYLYAFRTPRYVHETRGEGDRKVLEQLGLAPRSGWTERGFGTTALGLSIADPQGALAGAYDTSKGFLLWHSLWAKLRIGLVDITGGYQQFKGRSGGNNTLFVYPVTAAAVLRAPGTVFRPYVGLGGGLFGWQARIRAPGSKSYLATSGWSAGWTASAGLEYYLRPRVAIDVGVRVHSARIDGAAAGVPNDRLRFVSLWAGHYVRF